MVNPGRLFELCFSLFLFQKIQNLKDRMRILKESEESEATSTTTTNGSSSQNQDCPNHESLEESLCSLSPNTSGTLKGVEQSSGSTPCADETASSALDQTQPSTKHEANSAPDLEAVSNPGACNSATEGDSEVKLERLKLIDGAGDGCVSESKEEEEEEEGASSGQADSRAMNAMSPTSYSLFKECLEHVPEMNLPWQSMRNVRQCKCGVAFSYSVRKVCTLVYSVIIIITCTVKPALI